LRLGLLLREIVMGSASRCPPCGEFLAGDVIVERLDPLELRELCLELCRELAPFELVEPEPDSSPLLPVSGGDAIAA